MGGDILQQLQDIQDLPALPAVAGRVLELTEEPGSTAEDLGRVIARDPVLAGKTLRLVNSPYYGFPRRVGRISEAVVILGFKAVKTLALSVSVCDLFDGGEGGFDRRLLWEHSVGVAVASEMVARRAQVATHTEDLFVCGLLHDVGLLIEDHAFQDRFCQALDRAEADGLPIEEAERDVFGLDHAMIGKKVAEMWRLPETMCSVIGFHHQPQYASGEARREVASVYLADLICKLKGFGFDGDRALPRLRREPFQMLSLGKADLKALTAAFDQEMAKAEDFLELIKDEA